MTLYQWPIALGLQRGFGESIAVRRRTAARPHKGLDIHADVGTAVLSACSGRVVRIQRGTGRTLSQKKAGPFVDIAELSNGKETGLIFRYLHLGPDLLVKAGEIVKAGQILGTVGDRASSGIKNSKPHLHFEIRKGDYLSSRPKWMEPGLGDYGEPIDPLRFLTKQNKEYAMGGIDDINWRAILDAAITIGGPIIGTAIDAEAPGVGTVVNVGLQTVRKFVVDQYVPDGQVNQKVAAQVLQKAGWDASEVDNHLQGPGGNTGIVYQAPRLDSAQAAAIVYKTLETAGWSLDSAHALLQGPIEYNNRRMRSIPSQAFQDNYGRRSVDMTAHLTRGAAEIGGHTPDLYHGSDDHHLAQLGLTTELPATVSRKDS